MIKGNKIDIFLKNDFIFIDNINTGLKEYTHICFFGEYKSIEKFILNIIKENKKCFFDFYFSNLCDNDKENFLKTINYDKIINKFNFCKDEIYFDASNVNEEILKFIIKVSFNEILFSSFYFESPKITIWTNYNKQIIVFFNENKDFIKYKKLGIDKGLDIIFEKEY